MATRYSKRKDYDTVEYYDTREEMEAANPQTGLLESAKIIFEGVVSSFNPLFAFLAFIISLIVFTRMASQFHDIPVVIKFISVLGISTMMAYIAGKLGNAIVLVIVALLIISAIIGIGSLVWQSV